MKAGMIILPDEVHGREALVKQIQAAIRPKPPEESRYEELRRMGLDNETAREASGFYGNSDEVEYASAAIRTAPMFQDPEDRIKYVATVETQGSMRRIGEATGAALGSAMGLGMLRFATMHSAKLLFGGTLCAGGLVAVAVGGLVKAHVGKVAAAIAVVNVASVTALVALAVSRRK